jgi:hypothetical protein
MEVVGVFGVNLIVVLDRYICSCLLDLVEFVAVCDYYCLD